MSARSGVTLKPLAVEDLRGLFDYLAADSLAVALRFLESAMETFNWLATTPGAGNPCALTGSRTVDVRRWDIPGFPNHLIFYRPTEAGVDVLRVLHGARDLSEIFIDVA